MRGLVLVNCCDFVILCQKISVNTDTNILEYFRKVFTVSCDLSKSPWTLLTTGCIFPAGAATYADSFGMGNFAIGLPIFFFFISVLPALLIAIRQQDGRIAVIGLIAFQALFAASLPAVYSEILYFFVALQLLAIIISVFRGRQ